MKVNGEITVNAPRAAVFAALRDPQFFVSCVDGVHDLTEMDATHYTAVLETSVAYMKFKLDVAVEVIRLREPDEIETRIEGRPLGIAGRLSATSTNAIDRARRPRRK